AAASGPPVRMRRPLSTTSAPRPAAASGPSVALTIRAPRADETQRLAVVSGGAASPSPRPEDDTPERAAAGGAPAPGFRMRRSERSSPRT
ncbi:MAG: hypothetical protein ACRDYC_07920, partial [Acidimicrobiales bacterium]